jgi:hypothetical protein
MSVFTNFSSQPYKFLILKQTPQGRVVDQTFNAEGVFKLRDGMIENDSLESETADATLRIKPSEPFVDTLEANMVGQGVEVGRDHEAQSYRVLSQTEGYDYDLNRMDFFLLELKREDLVWEELESPLT